MFNLLRKEKYQLIGKYAAVKKCYWMAEALRRKRFCYKHKFYGIKSHRCIQLSPSPIHCTQRCMFCWRIQPDDIGLEWKEFSMDDWDDPNTIIEGAIAAQRRILIGYKGCPDVDEKLLKEAWDPKHVAISLAGEPTLYPMLSDLIQGFHKRGMTTFLVTNGTMDKVLEKLEEEPSQLYISLCAPDEETYNQLCRPQIQNAWSRLNRSLELMKSFSCPTVIRITLVKGYNMKDPEKYAKLIQKAEPLYIEPKAYMFVGYSRKRLKFENMPSHEEVRKFANELSKATSYKIIDESPDSRVVLLSRIDSPIKVSAN